MTELGINGLAPGFKYDVRVRGIFDGQAGEWSPTYEIDVFSDTVNGTQDKNPNPPTGLTITPTIDSFVINWTAPLYNANGTVLNDMKDYVLEISNDGTTPDVTYNIPEYNKPIDLIAKDRAHQFEFTYKMNVDAFSGTPVSTIYVKIYSRDTTNNRSTTALTGNSTNAAPSAPATLTATAYSGGVNLQWTASSSNDTVEYVLQSHTSSMANPPVTGTEIYRGNSLAFNHAVGSPTRYYRVGAKDIFGQTTWSSEQSATPGGISPSYSTPNPPTSLVESWVGASYRISWTASTTPSATDIAQYKIELTANSVMKTYWTTGTFFDIDPEHGKEFGVNWPYTPTLISVYSVGPSGLTSTALTKNSAFTAAPSTPAAPTLNSPTLSADGIVLTWGAITDPNEITAQIEVYASTATTVNPTKIVYSGLGSTFTHQISSAFAGTYYYRTRVLDVFGRYGAYSGEVSQSVTNVGAPTSVTVNGGALDPADPTKRTAMVNVNWTTPNSIIYAGTKIRYRIGAGTNTEIDVGKMANPNTSTSYTLRNLVPGSAYTVEVICYDLNGTLGNSGSWVAATGSPITVAKDTGLPSTPTATSVVSNTQNIQVTQPSTANDADGDVRYYNVYASTSNGFTPGATNLIGQLDYSVGVSSVGTFQIPTSGGGSTQTWYVRTKAVDWNGNESATASTQQTATPGLINTANITDAAITNAKINDLDAVKINAGTINAGRLGITSLGANIVPIEYCGFENRPSTYTSLFANTSATTSVTNSGSPGPRSGTQYLSIVTSSTTTETYFAPTTTSYNILAAPGETYIVSMYARTTTANKTVLIRFKTNETPTPTVQNSAALNVTTTGWTRISAAFVVPAGTNATGLQVGVANLSATGTLYVDDVMVEKGLGTGATAPSQFVSSTATVIDGNGILTGTVNADRLEANSAVVTDLTIGKSDNTPGTLTVQGTGGKVRSDSYVTSGGATGWQLDNSGLTINTGTIKAAALQIGGTGANMVPVEFSDFEATATLYDSGNSLNFGQISAPVLTGTSATQFKFGTRSAFIDINAAGQGIRFAQSATTYNIPVLSGKTYIVSMYLYVAQNMTVSPGYKPNGGSNTTLSNITVDGVVTTTATAGGWRRVAGTFTAASDTTVQLLVTFGAATGTQRQYIDGVMMEEQVGASNLPSGYVKPSTVIDGAQIITGSLNADRISTNTITAAQIASSAITADKISAGAISSNKFYSGTLASNLLANPAFEQVGEGAVSAGTYGDNEAYPGWTFGRTSPDSTSLYGVEYLTGGVTPRAGLSKLRLDCIGGQAGTYAYSDPIPAVVGNTYRVGGYYTGDAHARMTMVVETAGASTGPWTEQAVTPAWSSVAANTGTEHSAIFTDSGDQVLAAVPPDTNTWAATFNISNDLVTIADTEGHTFEENDLVYFSSVSTTTGISANLRYYLVNVSGNTFSLSVSKSGSAINLATGNGTGTMLLVSCSTTDTGDVFTFKNGHSYQSGDAIAFSTMIDTTGISTNTRYYVINPTSTTLQVSTSVGGAATTFTTGVNGGGAVVYPKGHNFVNGDSVMFKTITGTTGISPNTRYYVVGATATTFQVASTVGGAALALTTNGTGVIYAKPDLSRADKLQGDYTTTSGQTWIRLKFKNVGSTNTSSAYIDDAWVMQNGYGSVELTGAGLRMWDEDGEETISLLGEPVGGGSFLQIRDAGETMALIGADGAASFQKVETEELEINGVPIDTFITDTGRGVVAFGGRGTDAGVTGTGEDPYLEVQAQLQRGRTYRIHTSTFTVAPPGSGNSMNVKLRYTTDGTRPTNTSAILTRARGQHTIAGVDGRPTLSLHRIYRLAAGDGVEDFRVTLFQNGSAASAAQILGSIDPVQLWIEDIGPYIEDTGIDRGSNTTQDNWKVYTKTYNCEWSAIYDGAGNKLNGENDYVFVAGNSGLDYKSAFAFDSSRIQTDLSGATVLDVDLYMYMYATYNNNGATAVIGKHDAANEQSTWAGITGKSSDLKRESNWKPGTGKWVDLGDASFPYSAWANGNTKGILLGPAPSGNTDFVTYFRGVANSKRPVLRIKYKKQA